MVCQRTLFLGWEVLVLCFARMHLASNGLNPKEKETSPLLKLILSTDQAAVFRKVSGPFTEVAGEESGQRVQRTQDNTGRYIHTYRYTSLFTKVI